MACTTYTTTIICTLDMQMLCNSYTHRVAQREHQRLQQRAAETAGCCFTPTIHPKSRALAAKQVPIHQRVHQVQAAKHEKLAWLKVCFVCVGLCECGFVYMSLCTGVCVYQHTWLYRTCLHTKLPTPPCLYTQHMVEQAHPHRPSLCPASLAIAATSPSKHPSTASHHQGHPTATSFPTTPAPCRHNHVLLHDTTTQECTFHPTINPTSEVLLQHSRRLPESFERRVEYYQQRKQQVKEQLLATVVCVMLG